MADRNTKKKTKKSAKRGRARAVANRLGVLYLIVLLAFVGLSVRLFYIVRNNNNEYQKRILSQQAYDSKTLNAKRGEIVDANGTILAASKEKYNVILDVALLLSQDAQNQTGNMCQVATVNTLAREFGVDASIINQYIMDVPQSRYFVVKKGISYDEMARFLVYTTKPEEGKEAESLYNKDITGVWFEKYYVRDYPQGTLASDVLGFARNGAKAAYGLEEYYDDILTGTNGRQYGYLSDDTTLEYTTIPAVDGDTLVSTLDSNVQMMVEKHLREFCEQYKDNARAGLGANNIGCVVLKVDSGEVLAMASYPSFDPNDPTDLSVLYSEEEIQAMQEEGTFQDACDKLWKNFCITDTYEPGSVMKPFTVAMGLETGKVKGNEGYDCGGYLEFKGLDNPIFCHNRNGDGHLDVKGAVAQSCNVALMKMVSVIGKDIFYEFQNIFNFGLKTNIDLAGEARTDSLVFTMNTLGESELATASFGQGFNVNMMQMAAGYAALVNGGYYYEPHVISKILSSSGAVIKNIEPRLIKQVISQSTSDKIIEYCNAVVTDGTGWRSKPLGYAIGGKTGTAETLPRGNGEYVVSFISHAPAFNPEIVCYVVIDRPNVSVQEDAKYATIVSKEILTDILPYLGIPMTEELSDEQKAELNERDLSVFTNRLPKEEEDEPSDEDTENGENQN
ncbi:MAG: penicillin-binding protein 2 [Lachnospiraceae bacterium]|nr:penicillin-binding protein 2 [Lachnospiraceae bacterium]